MTKAIRPLSTIQASLMNKWKRLLLGNLLFAVLPAIFSALAIPAGILAFAVAPPQVLSPTERPHPKLLTGPEFSSHELSPNRAYVLDNSFIVGGRPPPASYQSSAEQTAFLKGTLSVTADVVPSRLIVLSSSGAIIGIWSNTGGGDPNVYSLTARVESLNGEVHPLTQAVLSEYSQLLDHVEWGIRGRVYP